MGMSLPPRPVKNLLSLGSSAESAARALNAVAFIMGGVLSVPIICGACNGKGEVRGFSGQRQCALCAREDKQEATYQIGGPC
jgi:hypothetical protein